MKIFYYVFFALFSYAATAGEIVATVNDEAISSYDVEARAKLIALQKSEKLTDQKKREYVGTALQLLIDEKVKAAEAKRNGFTVPQEDIQQAISHLEKQNNLNSGEMIKMLSKNGIPQQILENQIQADLLWLQVIQKNKSALPNPTTIEIEKRKNTLRNQLKEEGFYVAEILVPNKENAEKCFKELHQNISFQDLAKKYSKAESAKNGGEVGWIKSNHYSKEIIEVLRQMSLGNVSAPLKTPKGYLIVLLLDRKKPITTETVPVWELAQMGMKPTKTAALGKQITNLKQCSNFMTFAKQEAEPQTAKSGLVSPDQLPDELKEILNKEKTGHVIGPIPTPDVDLFFMKCNVKNQRVLPTNEEIKSQLEAEKLEELSDKLLRNAKRFVVVEKKK